MNVKSNKSKNAEIRIVDGELAAEVYQGSKRLGSAQTFHNEYGTSFGATIGSFTTHTGHNFKTFRNRNEAIAYIIDEATKFKPTRHKQKGKRR